MIFEEMNKHITIARILAGKTPRTESIARRQDSRMIFEEMNKHIAITRILAGNR